MTYRISGLHREQFAHLIGGSEEAIAAAGAIRVIANADFGWPCRISLKDAKAGDRLILLNYTSHDVATPYRSSYAIYINEHLEAPAIYTDTIPPVFEGRAMAFRAFDMCGLLHSAALAMPGESDAKIRALFAADEIAYIHAHNAAHGCFAARIERS
ncbi:MAG: DUF1203 domain-containing protein [Sphingorhabdus sp.]